MSAVILKFKKPQFKNTSNIRKVKETTNLKLQGEAICLGCKNEWVASIDIGTEQFKCPKCKSNKGIMKYFIDFREESYYKCGECDNPFLYLLGSGQCQCPVCGILIEYD